MEGQCTRYAHLFFKIYFIHIFSLHAKHDELDTRATGFGAPSTGPVLCAIGGWMDRMEWIRMEWRIGWTVVE
jgi:hypothetical protein